MLILEYLVRMNFVNAMNLNLVKSKCSSVLLYVCRKVLFEHDLHGSGYETRIKIPRNKDLMKRFFYLVLAFFMRINMSKLSLANIAAEYFTMRGYKLKKTIGDEDLQPIIKMFDLLIQKGNEVYPVLIKDWNRTVGVNIVINVDKVSQSAGFSNPILVAEKFSDHAKAYANRKGIKLITKSEIKREIKR
jgi:hypothetical protein